MSIVFMFSAIIHKFTKNKYQKRFPELDSLIVGEMEYLNTVKELGNDLEQIKNNEKLQQILTQATIMIVSVTASTTQGFVCSSIIFNVMYLQSSLTKIFTFFYLLEHN